MLSQPDIGRFLQPDPIDFNGDPTNLYRYCGNNPLKNFDAFGLWTGQIGGSWTGQLGPFTVSFSGGIAFDGHGNISLFGTGLGAPGAGADESQGVMVGFSANADNVNDLSAQFWNVGGEVSAGPSISVDAWSNTKGTISGVTVTIGGGAGGGIYGGVSNTALIPLGNIFNLFGGTSPQEPAPPPGGTTDIGPDTPGTATAERVVVIGSPVLFPSGAGYLWPAGVGANGPVENFGIPNFFGGSYSAGGYGTMSIGGGGFGPLGAGIMGTIGSGPFRL
jgi:hypothetical protein